MHANNLLNIDRVYLLCLSWLSAALDVDRGGVTGLLKCEARLNGCNDRCVLLPYELDEVII